MTPRLLPPSCPPAPDRRRVVAVVVAASARPITQPSSSAALAPAVVAATSRHAPRDPREASWPEFVRGAGAAFTNILVTFPIHKIMFRQQVEDKSALVAARSLAREGAAGWYRGVGPPLMQKTLSMSLLFGLFDYYYKMLQTSGVAQSHFMTSLVAALLAGSTESLLMPLERAQTLLQHRHFNQHFDNTWDVLVKLRHHGVAEYFRGLTPILLRNGPSSAMFFTLREPVRDLLPDSNDDAAWEIGRDFFSGAVLGASISTIFFPINVAKSVMQSQVGGPYPGVITTLRRVYVERNGWAGVFRGVQVNYARSLLSWGIVNSSYELFRKFL